MTAPKPSAAPKRVPAPKGLQAAGRALWGAIVGDLPPNWELDERELAVLALACRQADDIARLEAVLERDGVVVPGSTGQPRLSAVLGELRQSRLACSKLLGDLNLPDEDGKSSSMSSQRAARAAHSRWDRVAARKAAPRGSA